mmetsp:Transcript_62078/g.202586  ORF Transcript_62078/g.202586 Transcript_62078/m.202586 type:complete len:265 (-) Transcript_62078:1506-2300(-)
MNSHSKLQVPIGSLPPQGQRHRLHPDGDVPSHAGDLRQAISALGCCPRCLQSEHGSDAASGVALVDNLRGLVLEGTHVVSDDHDLDRNAQSTGTIGSKGIVQAHARIVHHDQHATGMSRGSMDRTQDGSGGGWGEEAAGDTSSEKPLANETGHERLMPGATTADNRDMAARFVGCKILAKQNSVFSALSSLELQEVRVQVASSCGKATHVLRPIQKFSLFLVGLFPEQPHRPDFCRAEPSGQMWIQTAIHDSIQKCKVHTAMRR